MSHRGSKAGARTLEDTYGRSPALRITVTTLGDPERFASVDDFRSNLTTQAKTRLDSARPQSARTELLYTLNEPFVPEPGAGGPARTESAPTLRAIGNPVSALLPLTENQVAPRSPLRGGRRARGTG